MLYQNAFSYYFQASEEAKVTMITIFKYLEPPPVVEQFEIVLNKLNEKIRTFHILSTFLVFI